MRIRAPLSWLACLAFFNTGQLFAAEAMATVNADRVNVRGQPSLSSEVVTQLQQGETVVVFEEITDSDAKAKEPTKWARIKLPANTPVWVYAPYIDSANKTVKVNRLNLRAGPGENYSILGRIDHATPVVEIRSVEDWMEIETPATAYAFVAANLLSPTGASGPMASSKPVQRSTVSAPPPTFEEDTTAPPASPNVTPPAVASAASPAVVTQAPTKVETPARSASEPPAITRPSETTTSPVLTWTPVPAGSSSTPTTSASAQASVPPKTETVPSSPYIWKPVTRKASTEASAQSPAPAAAAPAPDRSETAAEPSPGAGTTVISTHASDNEPLQERVVRREGIVRSTVSIQAPTYYELLSPENRKTINYLHTDGADVDLRKYRGRRIVVTGEEFIDPRWPRTPVIEVETLELIP